MRILHFSDIHFGRPSFGLSALLDKRLLGTFNYLFRRKSDIHEHLVTKLAEQIPLLKPDLIICSGDITCVGSPAEFEAACQALTPFYEKPDLPFVFVPGNHDAYVSNQTCTQALQRTMQILNPPALNQLLDSGFASLQVEHLRIGLLALAHPTNIFLSSGALSNEQNQLLLDWTATCKEKKIPAVLIGHFPTRKADGKPLGRRRHLKGGESLKKALDRGDIDLYLCGHIHSPFTHRLPSGSLECCTGSLTIKRVFSIIDMDEEGNFSHRYEKL